MSQSESENLLDIIGVLWQKRKSIIGVTVMAAILSVILSLLLDNYYQSSTQFYAASQDLAKPAPVGESERNNNFYGNDEDLDRLFSIAKSNQLKSFLIDSFDLYNHYEIEPDSKNAQHKIRLKLNKLYKTLKTPYDALELSIEDKDPQLAMNMANAARNKVSQLSQELIKGSQSKSIQRLSDNILAKEIELAVINDSLNILKKKYDVVDIYNEGEILASQKQSLGIKYATAKSKYESLKNKSAFRDSIDYLKSIADGLKSQVSALETSLNKYNDGYNIIVQLDRDRDEYSRQISLDRQRLNQLKASAAGEFQMIHVIEDATLPVYKSRPKRSLYVIGATLFAFILSSMGVLLSHSYRSVDWQKVFSK